MKQFEELIKEYKETVERKKRLHEPFHDKKRVGDDLRIDETIAMLVLESEMHLLKEVIEDLEYCIKEAT